MTALRASDATAALSSLWWTALTQFEGRPALPGRLARRVQDDRVRIIGDVSEDLVRGHEDTIPAVDAAVRMGKPRRSALPPARPHVREEPAAAVIASAPALLLRAS